jgi:tetratricopeptide (TPR) repeat protein
MFSGKAPPTMPSRNRHPAPPATTPHHKALVLVTAVLFAAFGVLAGACAATAPLSPKAVELNRAGTLALAGGNLELAEARFALALEYHPRFVEALTNLALVELQRGNFERARLDLERARRINSDLAQPHHGLGILAERIRRPDEAANHYRDALKVDPGFSPSRQNLARILFAAHRFDEAKDQFLRLVETAPDQLGGYTGLAETLLQLGRIDESDDVLRLAQRRLGEAPELVILEARQKLRLGDGDAAEALLLPLTHEPKSGSLQGDAGRNAWSWIAVARLSRGAPESALEAARSAFAVDPNDPVATYVVGLALEQTGDPRALVWLERANRLSPGNDLVVEALHRAQGQRRASKR